MPDLNTLRMALGDLSINWERSQSLPRALGMAPIKNPINLAGGSNATATLLSGRVSELFRVGEVNAGGHTAGLYLAFADQWHQRSSDREPYRRKVARALVENQQQDGRWLCILLDGNRQFAEAEFILPRRREGAAAGTTRALVNLKTPSRFHLDLLAGLDATGALNLAALSRKWSETFSVEAVTKKFHEEFRDLRDQFVLALTRANPGHPALKGRDPKKDLALLAFGTRQLGRLLFLWFLQQKRWLGGAPGNGSEAYLVDLFKKHGGGGDAFFNDVLLPLFFDALGQSEHTARHRATVSLLDKVPFLGGGLFRADQFEEELFGVDAGDNRSRRVAIPDAVFDPDPSKDGQNGHRTIFGFLNGYRFTTQESTPDDQSVDPDPELLGKVFENLYQEDDRHETGAYYTPREIVHYMCRQALDGYLRDQTGISQDHLDWLRAEAIDWTVSNERLGPGAVEALHHALDNVTVLDPAVGSGAFLVGTMQEIVLLRRGLVQSETDRDIDPASLDIAEWKRRAITQSLHGVDINPMAVEICKLRLWLSLVIDLQLEGDGKPIALPDLDFRILAGDSLVDRMGAEPFIQSLPDPRVAGYQPDMQVQQSVNRLQHEVDGLKQKFGGEGVTPSDQRDLSRRIRKAELAIARVQLDHAMYWARETVASREKNPKATKRALKEARDHLAGLERLRAGLSEGAPFQKPFLWPVNFHEVMAKGGFDIVLANPPYVRMESIDNIDEESYGHSFPEVAASRADMLVYFYARALQLLKDGGQLAFITSNKYMRAAYGQGIRELLPAKLQLRQVIDFGDLPLFTVAAYPAVVIGQKSVRPSLESFVGVADVVYPIRRKLAAAEQSANHVNVRLALEELPSLLDEACVANYPLALLRKDGWILEDPALVRLFDRLMTRGTPLLEFMEGRIFRGVVTGLNDAFVVDEAKRNELVAADRASADVIRPWLRGKDVQKWIPRHAGLHLIFANRGIDIQRYPAIKKHLAAWRAGLESRATAHVHPWYELQQPQEGIWREFERPKVIWPDIARSPRFAWDDQGFFSGNTTYFAPGAPKWLVAVLNSEVIEFLICQLSNSIRGGFVRLFTDTTALLPVVVPEKDIARELENCVDGQDDWRVNELVAEHYGLTRIETEIVRSWFANRSQFEAKEDVTDEE